MIEATMQSVQNGRGEQEAVVVRSLPEMAVCELGFVIGDVFIPEKKAKAWFAVMKRKSATIYGSLPPAYTRRNYEQNTGKSVRLCRDDEFVVKL